ncbi:uncharacterized protein LOC129612740 [Condylostylus longicornis]|uniref:uncharacterized protein LOC129612740 n=1 Tax=Condylostylus longicornis TaxID=2530218 RepID=UPI00244E0586|nr:uncharacterized protein LOC129612740 [Condylostylus longicornis]
MDQNFLYMFEFVIDDLLITHPNECAPEEYPTCVELTFRSSVFVQICDRDFGGCITTDPEHNSSKGGKCCLFGLDSQINDNDKLHIHVYKKKIEKCKFLLGITEIPLKNIFDRVTNEFIQNNPILEKKSINNEIIKQEEYCPSSEIEKKLLSLFDLQGKQTGNMVIIIRLSCMGPTIVSPFPFKKGCAITSLSDDETNVLNRVRGGENITSNLNQTKIPYFYKMKSHCIPKEEYFQNKIENNCDKDDIPTRLSAGADDTDTEFRDDSSENEIILNKDRKFAGGGKCLKNKPYGYDEFEADMNGSGLSIRVLKNAFQVNVEDSDYESENNCKSHRHFINDPEFQQSRFLNNQIRSQTGGSFINRKGLPKIRGNLKYAANDLYQENTNFELSMTSTNGYCNSNKIDKYRKRCPKNTCRCIQVQPDEIDDNYLTNINRKTRKDGIEICRKKCIDEDGDVFLFKLGKKNKCKDKQHLIEIELRTPKVPIVLQKQLVSQHTQIDEFELDSELRNICLKKRFKKQSKSK